MKPSAQNPESEFQRRRRGKVIGFIITEASAIGLLLLAGTIAVSAGLTNSTLILSINIITIAAGVAVALIPIIFFAIAPVLPGQR
jgi:hypothetical protein